MRELLSVADLRQLQIIEFLYKTHSSTLNKLSLAIGASEKTLRQDIKELNAMISPSKIKVSPKLGLMLQLSKQMSIESIYSLVLFSSTEFSIIESIFFHKSKTLDSLADSLFISKSTLRRTIVTMNSALLSLNFQIDSQKLDLVGNESQICNFIIHYFQEKYRNSAAAFPKMQIKVLDQLFLFALKEESVEPNYPDMEKLRFWILVILVRIQTGHNRTYTEEQLKKIPSSLTSNILIKRLFKVTFSVPLTPDTIYQLFYFFFNNSYCSNLNDLNKLTSEDPDKAEFVASLYLFLENISKKLSIKLINQDELVLNLYNLDSLYYGKSYILYDRYQAFIESITHDYSNFYQFIKSEINLDPYIKKKNWSQDAINVFFYMLITHWPDLANEIEKNLEIFSVGLFFSSDIEHTQMIHDQLSYLFHNRLHFSIINVLTLNDLKKKAKNYDIILTDLFDFQTKESITIVFPLVPNISDFKKIDDAYLSLLRKSDPLN